MRCPTALLLEIFSVVYPYRLKYGFGSSFLHLCGSGSRDQTNADPDPGKILPSLKVEFLHEKKCLMGHKTYLTYVR
jgi:hypothetical protein